MIVPAGTDAPRATATVSRYEYEVRTPPPWYTVTLLRPATEPANVTVPAAMTRTGVPGSAAKSRPQ